VLQELSEIIVSLERFAPPSGGGKEDETRSPNLASKDGTASDVKDAGAQAGLAIEPSSVQIVLQGNEKNDPKLWALLFPSALTSSSNENMVGQCLQYDVDYALANSAAQGTDTLVTNENTAEGNDSPSKVQLYCWDDEEQSWYNLVDYDHTDLDSDGAFNLIKYDSSGVTVASMSIWMGKDFTTQKNMVEGASTGAHSPSTLQTFVKEAMLKEPFGEAHSASSSIVLHTIFEGEETAQFWEVFYEGL